jgi:transcriptional regulator with GAF, ATPase, and Fis domain
MQWTVPIFGVWRKLLLLGAAAATVVYTVAVFCFVPWTPDLGFRCAFSPVVQRVTLSVPGDFPAPGDHVLRVGDYSFPDKDSPQFWAQVQLLRKLMALDAAPVEQNSPWVRAAGGGRKEVQVTFWSSAEGREKTVWCLLRPLPPAELIPSVLWFLVKLGLFSIGALVFWKRPDDRSAALFFLLCTVTLGAYMGGYHWTRIATQPALILPFIICAVMMPAVGLHFYLTFPRPKGLVQRWPGRTYLVVYGIPFLFLAALVATYFHLRSVRDAEPASISPAWNVFGDVITAYLGVAAAWYLASVAALVHSYATAADATERNQVKWITFGSVLALLPIGYTLYLALLNPDDFGAGAATWPMFAASVCFTVAFAVSITRYRLMQLDQLLSSGMVYFVISFLAGVVYYAVVFVGMLVSGVIQAPSFPQALAFSLTALTFLLVLDLARNRFKRILDRRFDRQKLQLDRTLQRLGEAIEQLVDPPTVARRLLQASADVLNVRGGAVYLREGDPPVYRLVGCVGSEPPPLAELPPGSPLVEVLQVRPSVTARPGLAVDPVQRQLRFLRGCVAYGLEHKDRLLAFLVLGPKATGPYEASDLELLSAFAQLTSLALENADGHRRLDLLNRDLQTKVEQIAEQQHRIVALQAQLTGAGVRAPAVAVKQAAADGPPVAPPAGVAADAWPAAAGIVGSSTAMCQVLEVVRKAANSPSAVLIYGESGTGKELIARALHELGPRAGRPYVKVHCAALAPTLLESELFGHVKGAFTGAHRDKVGRFELADGGTIFLDEIGDVSLEVQTKLLRVLQEKTIERVGSSTPLTVDVRVIAATHQDLDELMRQKRFRGDLYFRLKVIPIAVPPLRARREDIPELARHFLARYATSSGNRADQLDDDALAALKGHDWPGNVRELENVIERALVIADGPAVTLADLPPELQDGRADGEPSPPTWTGGPGTSAGLRAEREERGRYERERLVRALAAAGGNKAEAARALGLARSTLVSRLRRHGLS